MHWLEALKGTCYEVSAHQEVSLSILDDGPDIYGSRLSVCKIMGLHDDINELCKKVPYYHHHCYCCYCSCLWHLLFCYYMFVNVVSLQYLPCVGLVQQAVSYLTPSAACQLNHHKQVSRRAPNQWQQVACLRWRAAGPGVKPEPWLSRSRCCCGSPDPQLSPSPDSTTECCHHHDLQEKKGKDYAFWRQFKEKPCIILGCHHHDRQACRCIWYLTVWKWPKKCPRLK